MWEGQLAVIARTNAMIFDSMVDLCNQHDTYKFGFAGVSVSGVAAHFKKEEGRDGQFFPEVHIYIKHNSLHTCLYM